MSEISRDVKELEKRPSPYRKIVMKSTLRGRVKRFIPKFVLSVRDYIKSRGFDMDFIE